ncbi:hypothetical protein PTTG_29008 [Puccinia triticina 1-1 BBBD Race 1]|uniref:Peptidase A2 domain-containing protein n=1 Tax=Puccinia triticina (isolate 1-1 / race 1 (BBBD)) TaxID=630390 RepID=A0A180G741_PUCT1|nr:hypothetical protein PTTG_29008 [Puccinia triticina 1-1 BBBD Race 1]
MSEEREGERGGGDANRGVGGRGSPVDHEHRDERRRGKSGGVKKWRCLGVKVVPPPSSRDTVVKVGSCIIVDTNAMDPRLFASLSFSTLQKPQATTPLIDSGATHDVLSEQFATKMDLCLIDSSVGRTISGFDGSKSQSSKEVQLILDTDTNPTTFIITRLKDAYDGILGMPWIKKHGHHIDWRKRQLIPNQTRIAAAEAASSPPPTTSQDGEEPGARQARRIDEGVPTWCGITPPRCLRDLRGRQEHPTEYHRGRPDGFVQAKQNLQRRGGARREACEAKWRGGARPRRDNTPAIWLGTTGKRACPLEHIPQDPSIPRARDILKEIVAAACVASSIPKKTSTDGEEPVWRQARLNDKGGRNLGAITPPQCESGIPPIHQVSIRATGKQAHPLGLDRPATVDAAKALWSTSAQLAAQAKQNEPKKLVEELVPLQYHHHLGMFWKTEAQRLPPRRKYDFRVNLLPGAVPHANVVTAALQKAQQSG